MTAANDNVPILITIKDACRTTSLSRTMVNRLRGEDRFPLAVDLGERRIAFVRAEVEAWVAAKIADRTAGRSSAA
jgi:prophage regulatory protein